MSDPFQMSSSVGHAGVAVDAGLRTHMQRVYNRMSVGLLITAVVSYIAANSSVVLSLIASPVGIVLALAPLAVIWFGFNPRTMTANQLRGSFVLLSVLYGLSFATIFLLYVPADIVRALLITTIMFAGLSIFGYTTKRDLAPVGVFCVMAMLGLLAFSLIMMGASLFGFGAMGKGMTTVVSLISIVVFAGLTAWETQATKEMYRLSNGDEMNSRMAWAAALNLYISFIAMFQYILSLTANNRN